jgi:hypothetical protein
MALTTYAELKAAIADFANRTDLTAPIVDFITLAEARLYDEMILKNMESEETLTLVTSQNYVALPSGFISPIALWLVVSSVRVPLSPALPQELPYDTTNNQPQYWAIDGANIRFDCPAADNYTAYLRCVKKSNLSGSVATNYLLERRPDIYLAASMAELARYTRDVDLFNTWESKLVKEIASFKNAENRARGMVPMRNDVRQPGINANIFTE